MDQATIEFWRFAQSIVGILLVIIGFFIMRTLKTIDTNQKETAKTLEKLSIAFYSLKGEHDVLARNCTGGQNISLHRYQPEGD